MKFAALALLASSSDALLAPRPPRASAALSAAARGLGDVPGATQRVRSTYDLTIQERTLATERDACGVGFVAESAAGPSRRVMEAATAACDANEHRGGCSSDCVSGDGAGIMTQIPWAVYEDDTPALKKRRAANPSEKMGVATLFVPRDAEAAKRATELTYEAASLTGFEVVAWRDMPIDPSICGSAAEAGRPDFAHVFLATAADVPERDPRSLERALYIYRRTLSGLWDREEEFYVASCSSKTVVYKGMVQSSALKKFYLDLANELYVSQFAIYHRRFSTNTMPRWSLAQPFRQVAHNGEINTIRGNVNWMVSRALAAGADMGAVAAGCTSDDPDRSCEFVDVNSLGPVVDASKSDSANLDASLELYTRAGRTVDESLLLMMPPALPAPEEKLFFDLHAPLQEAWDGPAAVCYSDGDVVGARLDRNGLRPARITRYRDGFVCLSSETGSHRLAQTKEGTSAIPPDSEILERTRLGPGMMCKIDLVASDGGYFDDAACKAQVASNPKWAEEIARQTRTIVDNKPAPAYDVGDDDVRVQAAFGWGSEDVDMQVLAMVASGGEATHCMGADAPLAAMSTFAHPAYDYFKQRHAQVTNPPIDSIREGHVMTTDVWLGQRPNCVDVALELDAGANLVRIETPVMHQSELDEVTSVLETKVLDTTYDPSSESLEEAVKRISSEAVDAVEKGAHLVVLSDKAFVPDGKKLYVQPLVAVGAAHHALISSGLRMSASLVVETAQIWSTHHVATLIGYGASAVHPYMLFRVATSLTTPPAEGKKPKAQVESNEGIENARKALKAGVLKIMSKIGISTLSSYHGAQIFECIGLHPEVVDVAFKGTASRVGGLDFAEMQAETASLVKDSAFGKSDEEVKVFKLANYGFINALQKGRGGEEHANSPKVAKLLHKSVREDDPEERKKLYNDFVKELTETSPFSLRDLLQFKWASTPSTAPSDAKALREITERFVTGGMSLGALSRETHESLAMAMNRLGAASNSGEGGEDKVRNNEVGEDRDTTWAHLRGKSIVSGDIAQSQIRQVASGRFGVTAPYLAAAAQIEIKVAQGAKPGEGGQLPGQKVDSYIASVRAATEGVTLISPPPHHDIYSIEDLAQLIFDLKAINPKARISVKLVSIIGIGTVACGVAKAGADVIQISGHDGGSGAAAISSIKHAGAPVELGLAESHTTLTENGLRDLVTIRADGGVRTGADVVKLALLGAEEFGFGTVAMVAAGCVMARVCHTNNCPVGVATQKEKLRARVRGEPEDVTRYFECCAEETSDILRKLGLGSLREAVGRIDLLELLEDMTLTKTKRFDVATTVLKPVEFGPLGGEDFVAPADPAASRALLCPGGVHFDDQYVGTDPTCTVEKPYELVNTDRAVGARLAGDIARRQRAEGTIKPVELHYHGAAGQSFMAFAVSEMKVRLEGDANDYVCKGLSGAHIAIFPPREAEANGDFSAKDSVIIGNTCLYGATSGKFFAAGQAGDRFGVRNSGVQAVIEGSGDHCCEYMTNGVVLVLGPTGINAGSGMTGGVAYFYDPTVDDALVESRLKLSNVKCRRVQAGSPAADTIKRLLQEHVDATASKHAAALLAAFDASHFAQICPPSEMETPHHAVTPEGVGEEVLAVSR